MQPADSTTSCNVANAGEAVTVRPATMEDVPAIHQLVSFHAERGRMLFRPLSDLYEHLRDFFVAERNGAVVGCVAVELVWRDLAEIKTLAVEENTLGRGIGRQLVETSLAEARRLKLACLFVLTRERRFFEKLGFREVSKDTLPHKVWTDCVRCPVKESCDEIAMICTIL